MLNFVKYYDIIYKISLREYITMATATIQNEENKEVFLIRKTAFEILVDVYSRIKGGHAITDFDKLKYGVEENHIDQSLWYLEKSGYIETIIPTDRNIIRLTLKGIDKAEDLIENKE